MRVERPCKPLSEVVAGSFQNEPEAGSKYVLALRMLIALAFRKKRQQVYSRGWQFYASNLLICFINPQPTCDALAALISCRPHRAPNVCSTLRYFPPPNRASQVSAHAIPLHADRSPLRRSSAAETSCARWKSAFNQVTRTLIGRHCARRRPNDLRIWGCRFHVRS